MVNWLIDWLIYSFICWFIYSFDWLVRWFIHWLVNWWMDWFVHWLVHFRQFIHWLVYRLIHRLVHQLIVSSVQWSKFIKPLMSSILVIVLHAVDKSHIILTICLCQTFLRFVDFFSFKTKCWSKDWLHWHIIDVQGDSFS